MDTLPKKTRPELCSADSWNGIVRDCPVHRDFRRVRDIETILHVPPADQQRL
jgi:hypothetical protein